MQENKVVAHLLAGAAFGELALMQVSYPQIYESPESFCSLCLTWLRPELSELTAVAHEKFVQLSS